MEEEDPPSRLTLFGKDVATIPCFRNSWLYGLSSGVGAGLMYFMFTSKPRLSSHVGFGTMMLVTGGYWMICRYNHERQIRELQEMREYVQRRMLAEGTEMEKVYEAEVATVSNPVVHNV